MNVCAYTYYRYVRYDGKSFMYISDNSDVNVSPRKCDFHYHMRTLHPYTHTYNMYVCVYVHVS